MGTSHKYQHTSNTIFLSFLHIMRNISDKSCREIQNTCFIFNNSPPPENRAVYEIIWKNTVELSRLQITIWSMRIACWIPKATNTLLEQHLHYNNGCTNGPEYYVILLLSALLVTVGPCLSATQICGEDI